LLNIINFINYHIENFKILGFFSKKQTQYIHGSI